MLKPVYRVPCCLLIFLLLSLVHFQIQAQCVTPTTAGPFCAGGNCDTDAPTFQYNGSTPPGTSVVYKWDFGDQNVTTDTLTTTTNTATYAYQQPGSYTVTVKVFINGVEQPEVCASTPVTVNGINQFTIGPVDENLGPQEEEFCIDADFPDLVPEFQGGAEPANATYTWTGPGVTDATRNNRSISFTEEGCYSLTITDQTTGCTRTNKLDVRLYKPDPTQPPPPQDQARWIFGTNVEIRFTGGQPNVTNELPANAPQGSSSVLDSEGELLFYTDGTTVYNSTGAPMLDINNIPVTGADGLTGSPTASQGVTIVAQPGCDNCQTIYYIFTTTEVAPSGSQVFYSVVDMSLNNNLGTVIQKNVPMSPGIPSTERVISVQGNPTDPNATATTWIVTHDFTTATFRVYPLTAQGVGAPVTYTVGTAHGPEPAQGEGYMKVSPDGSKLAVVIPGSNGVNNKVEIFDFDTATGEVSNPVTMDLGPAPPTAYGLEFAGQELFVSLTGDGSAQSQLYRYNLASSDSLLIAQSKDTIASSTDPFGALQIGPDQVIYLAIEGSGFLGTINNATDPDPANVDFQIEGLSLNGGTSGLGLPNNSPSSGNSYGQSLSFDGPSCAEIGEIVQYIFTAQPDRAGGDPEKSSYQWTITNLTTGAIVRSVARGANGQNATLTVDMPGPGDYRAELTIFNDCNEDEGGEAVEPQDFTIFQSPPPVQLGPDKTVCTGTTVTLDAYINGSGPAGAQYFWTSPDGTTVQGGETFTATLGGAYTAIVLVGQCVETGTVNVILTGPPANFLGNDVTLCEPTSLVLDAGVAPSGNVRFEWRNVTTNQVIGTSQTITVTPTTTTTYRATVTNLAANPACTVTDDITVTVSEPFTVTATSAPASGCVGNPIAADGSITLTVPAGTFTYLWTKNGAQVGTTKDLTGLEPGIYQVVVTNTATGCTATLSKEVNSIQSTIILGDPAVQNAVCSTNNGSITINVTSGTPTNFIWRDAANAIVQNGPSNVLVAPAGTYSVEVEALAGCQAFQSATIEPAPNSPVANPRAVVTSCGQVTLFPGASGDFIYQWKNDSGDIATDATTGTAIATTTGLYTLSIAQRANPDCSSDFSIQVTVTPAPPAITVATPAPVCQGQPVTLNATSPNWTIYTWTLPDNTTFSGPVLNATIGGTYRLTVRNATGCESTTTVNVTITPTPARPTIANPAPVICSGAGIPPFTISNPTNNTYIWYDNANLTSEVGRGTSFSPNLTSTAVPGVYAFYVVQTAGTCRSEAAEARLTINRSPVVNLGADRSICIDDAAVLDATNQGDGVTYRWSTTETTPTIRPTRSGTYSVTVTIGNCSVTDEVAITILPAIRTNVVTREVAVCTSDRPVRPINLDAGPGDFTYFWPQLNSRERIVEVTQPGVYDVVLTNPGGCTKTEQITVLDRCDARVFVPDAFTPDASGLNDVLEIKGDYITDSRIEIYNRWGEVVFAAEGILEDGSFWDGTYLGQPAPVGTYAWKITYRSRDYPDREPVVMRGGVLLIR
ncbi:PKD domain-containing protein [Rhodocytophaga aerolata]|uniref:PKD domain-containing protein n=1 Tax=Rhodocytophaga aerolata TaxID=455078 RepID=A0ABT8R6A7_9BACT|nr:PKD domain-containing protein [Rhodocytophaga aerolata]MDO1447629.1 PKD domain-containing protein [Rhodocytophaga aerolata]